MLFELFEIFRHEFRSFFKSSRSTMFLLLGTSLIWGAVIAGKVDTINSAESWLWVVFFSLVAEAGFSSTVFVRERLSSTIEILLVSGVERASIFHAKLFFTGLFTILTGLVAFTVAWVGRSLILREPFFLPHELIQTITLFVTSSILVSSSSAMFSFALTNPRLVQFLNFFVVAFLASLFAVAGAFWDLSLYLLAGIELILGLFFVIIARILFSKERIIQPLVY